MKQWLATARTLSEALPFLQRYDDAKIVIKLGGHAMSDNQAMNRFARDIVLMKQTNIHPVIVHGGGPMIDEMLERLNISTHFIDGKRVTTPEVMSVVEMVLSGSVNKEVVSALTGQGGKAIGISGKDGALIRIKPLGGEMGLVGEPDLIRGEVLDELMSAGFIPVIAPIGADEEGATYNINGDSVAGAIAQAIKADRLLLLTDVDGVRDGAGNVRAELSPDEVKALRDEGVITGGMIPKLETAVDAVKGGVRAAVILDGRAAHAVLLELFTRSGAGTLIRA